MYKNFQLINLITILGLFLIMSSNFCVNKVFCSGNGIFDWFMGNKKSPIPSPSIGFSGEGKGNYNNTRTNVNEQNYKDTVSLQKELKNECDFMTSYAKKIEDKDTQLKLFDLGMSCYDKRVKLQMSLNTLETNTEGQSLSGSVSSSGSLGKKLAESPSYIGDFRFFHHCDVSILGAGFLSYIFFINILLQLYIFFYLCKSFFVKEYIFSYFGILKGISFSFWEFFIFFFVGIFYIFIFYFIVIHDLNLETTQVAISNNYHNHQMARLTLKSTRFFLLTSLGIDVDPPCKDGDCFD